VLGLQQHPLTPDHFGSPAQLMLQETANRHRAGIDTRGTAHHAPQTPELSVSR
jgi:hypothetical protein